MAYYPAPTLTKINPSSANRGKTINVGFKGKNFLSGVSKVNVGADMTVNNVTVHRADSLTANLAIGKNATPGGHNFSVTNSGPGGGTSENQLFTIINQAPTKPRLLVPANKDTIKLVTPAKPIKFVWRKSTDGDAQDTLKYSLNIKGPGLDTTVAGVKDTSLALNIMPRLKVASNYSWTVKVTDGFITVASPDTFRFRTSNKITGVDDHYTEIPKAYLLEQNYPNPFNPTTKIRFELPKSVRVSLKIYDMLGQEVAVLVDEEKPAGRYEVVWEPIGVSSGVYLYRLQAGAFVQVKKMILSR
ncbi:MAG: T9SS type A sorting domain-containing protein [candidate division KSB1 bacterium]|nr:T9SS type A sorting domain-containing protein [candidate division KSB1 bacterium]MDZ7302020.1 T9SS type A sorting domain-containing protein [candidate division KSB1 bacterium]MDZ7310202.1 T9SS type A sorting domain-containing protein [candidate division KSB1 bacterium]